MPIGTTIALLTAAAAAGSAGAGIYGAHKAGDANELATQTQAKSAADAIALQREQDAQTQKNFDTQQAASKAQWDAQQQIRAPYRAAGLQSLMRLGDLIGTHYDPAMMQAPAYVPPTQGPSGALVPPMANPNTPPPYRPPMPLTMQALLPGSSFAPLKQQGQP